MTSAELHADFLQRSGDMLKATLADFSDADMLGRPCLGANHPNWQFGHLINAETFMLNGMGVSFELPAGFAEKYGKSTAGIDDPAKFAKKDELLGLFDRTRVALVKFAREATQEQLDKPAPERIQRIAPTVGHLVLTTATHAAMHVGQFQVARRKLGKPVLF
jgi:hypothetical protein